MPLNPNATTRPPARPPATRPPIPGAPPPATRPPAPAPTGPRPAPPATRPPTPAPVPGRPPAPAARSSAAPPPPRGAPRNDFGFGPVVQLPSAVTPVGQAGAPTAGGAAGPTTLDNTSAPSPYLEEQLGLLRERLGTDTTRRAIDRSNLGIADSAALLAKDAKANTGRRGVIGTEVADAYLGKNVFKPAQQLAAREAANISMDAERRKDALVLGSQGIFQAPDQYSLANRRLGLDQWSAQSNDQARRAAAAQAAKDAELARWLALQQIDPNAFGGTPSGSGGGSGGGVFPGQRY